jgi:3-oxoacyl-[acyl-carrier-protein] synthase II
MKLKRVVITGLGALTPIGNTVSEFWRGLTEGRNGAAPVTRFDPTHYRTKFACELKGFDPLAHLDRKEARHMDPFCHYALVTAEECLRDSGLNLQTTNLNRVGVIWASGIGGLETFEQELLNFARSEPVPRFNPYFIPKMIINESAGHISMRYGFRGINFSTVSACAASTNAIADAFNYLRLGKANAILTGGSEAAITRAGMGGFGAMKAMSERNDDPATACRPFDKDRDGFVLGEGAGALLLEELDHAQARGAKIYGEVVGCGFAGDAYHITATHPEGEGAYLAMRDALDDAGLAPQDVDYLNAHATSTPLGDVSEIRAIGRVFGDYIHKLHISATKSMTGHLLGAAGAIEAIASVLALNHNLIPPTINLAAPDPAIPAHFNLTPHHAVSKPLEVAMSNTFGFGGHNAIALFKKWRE